LKTGIFSKPAKRAPRLQAGIESKKTLKPALAKVKSRDHNQ